jgi:putative transposase
MGRDGGSLRQIVRPETIRAWFRQLVAQKYDGSIARRCGRPRKALDIRELALELARENRGWGYTKIRDALRGLRIEIGRSTVANMLSEAGIEPVPQRHRKRTWKQFLRSHWETFYACDFFSAEVLSVFGTVRYMVFFVMEVKTRAVHIPGVRIAPDGESMKQIGRNLVDPADGFLRNARYLIHDRDPVFTEAWKALLETGGVKWVPIPAQSPNSNPNAERFVKAVRTECLDNFLIFGERHLRYFLREFTGHYLTERCHQEYPAADASNGDWRPNHQTDAVAKQRQRDARPNRMPVSSGRSAQLLLPRSRLRRGEGFSDSTASATQAEAAAGCGPIARRIPAVSPLVPLPIHPSQRGQSFETASHEGRG